MTTFRNQSVGSFDEKAEKSHSAYQYVEVWLHVPYGNPSPPKRDWEKRYNTKNDQRNKHYAKNRKR